MAKRAKKTVQGADYPDSRLPPHDVEAEEAVVGSLLIDDDSILEIRSFLKPSHFFIDQTKWAYEACLNIHDRDDKIDQISVAHELLYEGKLAEIGGAAYLSQLIAQVPTSLNIGHYAKLVYDSAQRRSLLSLISKIINEIYNPQSDIGKLIDAIAQNMDMLGWPTPDSRLVRFKNGKILTSSPPIYIFTVCGGDKEITMRFESDVLDRRDLFQRKLRENLHYNPILPDLKKWGEFINKLVTGASKEETPAETKVDQEVVYWLREWFKGAAEAQIGADMDRGWKRKDDYYCIQPDPVCRWLKNHAKLATTPAGLWAVVQGYGAKKKISVRISKKEADSLKLWGIPCSFFDIPSPEEDLSWLEEDVEDTSWLDGDKEE